MKYRILSTDSLKQMQAWFNQYNTNSGGQMEIIQAPTWDARSTSYLATIKYKPWAEES